VLRQALHEQLRDAARHPGWRRVIVLLGDGEPHDIDVHEPGYLQADLRAAARPRPAAWRCAPWCCRRAGPRPCSAGSGPAAVPA
jgi:hypothetical protein